LRQIVELVVQGVDHLLHLFQSGSYYDLRLGLRGLLLASFFKVSLELLDLEH